MPVVQLRQVNRTDHILAESCAAPLHLWPRERLANQPVSSVSLWQDARWTFDNGTPGALANVSRINWSIELPDGTNLLDPPHADLLDWLRRLVWSAAAAPGDGARALAPGSVGTLSCGIVHLVPWMVEHHLCRPDDLTPSVVRDYVRDLQAAVDDDDDDASPALTEGVAAMRLRPLVLIWRQRRELQRAGIPPMPAPPFGRGRDSAKTIAKRIAKVATGAYRPLPDEVAIPVLNAAMAMLGARADDVMRLVETCEEAYASGLAKTKGVQEKSSLAASRQLGAARAFRFSSIDGEPWHRSLDPDDWDLAEVQEMEFALRTELARRRADWTAKAVPSLPIERVFSKRTYVDLRRFMVEMGRPAADESMVKCHPRLHALVAEAAQEQGLYVPFIGTIQRVRQLVQAIRGAAHLVIQSTTGMRISEICAISAGIDSGTGLPSCVERSVSTSGYGIHYTLKSKLSKTEKTPRTVEWTLGFHLAPLPPVAGVGDAPSDDHETDLRPPAIRAILVLNRLLRRWRELLGTNDLFVESGPNGLPKTRRGVHRATSSRLRDGLRNFVAEWVDLTGLPDEARYKTMEKELVPYRESNGRVIKTHQFRKLFANFAYRVDKALLPILQMHFHHVSLAMTQGYTGVTRDWLPMTQEAATQHAAMLALEVARGDAPLAGRYGEDLETKIAAELRPTITGLPADEAYAEAFEYVDDPAFRELWVEPYGICGARSASEMACHVEADTVDVARWSSRLRPNYATRTPSMCAGCPSFVIARWHRPYWEDSYVEHASALRSYRRMRGGAPLHRDDPYVDLTTRRMNLAAGLCRKLGADMDALELRVQAADPEMAL